MTRETLTCEDGAGLVGWHHRYRVPAPSDTGTQMQVHTRWQVLPPHANTVLGIVFIGTAERGW